LQRPNALEAAGIIEAGGETLCGDAKANGVLVAEGLGVFEPFPVARDEPAGAGVDVAAAGIEREGETEDAGVREAGGEFETEAAAVLDGVELGSAM